jgi:hypothetical protein
MGYGEKAAGQEYGGEELHHRVGVCWRSSGGALLSVGVVEGRGSHVGPFIERLDRGDPRSAKGHQELDKNDGEL